MLKRTLSTTGFSIIELAVAAVVGGMVLVALYTTMLSVAFSNQAIIDKLSTSRVGPVILNMMSKDLKGCYVPNTDEPFFDGKDSGGETTSNDSIHFVTTSNSILPTREDSYADYIEVGYLLAHSQNRGFFTLYRREDFYIDEDPLKGGKYIELYDMVKRMNIEYYDSEDEEWKDEWNINGVQMIFNPPEISTAPKTKIKTKTNPQDSNNNNNDEAPAPAAGSTNTAPQNQIQNEADDTAELLDAREAIRFPDAIRITLELGVPPSYENWRVEDVKLETFTTIVSIPVAMKIKLPNLAIPQSKPQSKPQGSNTGG